MLSQEDQFHTWYDGRVNDKEGVFPSKMWLYRPNGNPVSFSRFSSCFADVIQILDDDGNHSNQTIVQLIPNSLYLDYCRGGREQVKSSMQETKTSLDFNPAMIW